MIPQKLRLKNFLSYQQLALDFSGLHVACICGANGAGKSSLLEAISWAIWGVSRVVSQDDVIHVGSKEAQVVKSIGSSEPDRAIVQLLWNFRYRVKENLNP